MVLEGEPGFVGPSREVVPKGFVGPLQPSQRRARSGERLPSGSRFSDTFAASLQRDRERRERERLEAEKKARELAIKKAEEKRKLDTIERDRRIKLTREQNRINSLRRNLERQNSQLITRNLINRKTGDKIKQQTLYNPITNERLFTRRNLTTGETTTRTFQRPRGGGRIRQTGGLIEKRNTLADVQNTQKRLGEGEKVLFNPITFEITGIQSTKLNQIIPCTEEGLDFYSKQVSKLPKEFKLEDFKELVKQTALSRKSVKKEEEASFIKGLQKVALSPEFQPESIRKEREEKQKESKKVIDKMRNNEKLTESDIKILRDSVKLTPEKIIDKDVAKFAKITGGILGIAVPLPGALLWALGDTMDTVRASVEDGGKVTSKEFRSIVLDSATKAAVLGFLMKAGSKGADIASKRILTGVAVKNIESKAIVSALNHGGQIIKIGGFAGKNFITTYFYKDMIGNVFDITLDVKNGRLNNALRKAIETGGSIGGYIGGSALGNKITKGALFAAGKLKATVPEFAQKKIPLDVMARQLLREGKIVLTRRGVYETGKGLSPRKDAWLDSKVKNPTKSIFWRFDKTLNKKDEAISPLPLFTKQGSGYWKMFKANWIKNKGMNPIKRYIKTTAETPLIEDVVIRKIVNLKSIKDINLRKQIIKEYATTGKLSKKTQEIVLKNNFPISDKNREFGFHDENEFVTRTGFKFKGRTDISWTYDPVLNEYIPVVQNLKDAGKIKNFLSILNKKKIITRTDAQFIADNFAIKKEFKARSILPKGHSYEHMKNVEKNIIKLMDKYPEFNKYWIRRYGSVSKAKTAVRQAMWHDIGKTSESSVEFGTSHGEKVWRVWKAGLLPKDIKLTKRVAKSIRVHETLDPRKLFFKVKNRLRLITPEEKIVATADRLDLSRYKIKIDTKRLPLKDALQRLKIDTSSIKYPFRFKDIITRIKLDRRVTKSDIKKLFSFLKKDKKVTRITKKEIKLNTIPYQTAKYASYRTLPYKNSYRTGFTQGYVIGKRAPFNYKSKYKGVQSAYTQGYRDAYRGGYRINYKTGVYKRPKPTKRPVSIVRRAVRTIKKPISTRPRPKTPRRAAPITQKKKRKIIMFIPKGFGRKVLSKPIDVYLVTLKIKGKWIRLKAKPFSLNSAKDFLAHELDRGLSRSAFIEPLGKSRTIVALPKKIQGYFSRNKRKFRPFKIKRGIRKALVRGYIEKKKFVGDTPQEIKKLRIARILASKKTKLKVKKRIIKRKKRNVIKRKPIKKIIKKKVMKRRLKLKSQKKKIKPRKIVKTKRKLLKKSKPKNKMMKKSQKKKVKKKKKK